MRFNDRNLDRGVESAGAPTRGDHGHTLPYGELTDAIIGAMFRVHTGLGAGFLESVYANALAV